MSIAEAKTPRTKPAPQTKLCSKCGKVKPITNFTKNRDWDEEFGYDRWCKDCLTKCATREAMAEYFWENHREWNEAMWESAKKKAESQAANNVVYQKSGFDRRATLLEAMICAQLPRLFTVYYKYYDPTKRSGALTYAEALERGEVEALADEGGTDKPEWSDEWYGEYTKRDLAWLNNYYEKLKHDNSGEELEFDAYMEEAVHNIAVQTLILKKLQMDYRSGRGSLSDVKDAQTVVDMLTKSTNLAACKRKPKNEQQMLSVGEIALYLETHGHPCTRKIEWEPDDVDRSIAELHHIVRAVGLDQ